MCHDNASEFDVWHGLANLYSTLSHWKDAEICLGKARELKQYSAEALHIEGKSQNLVTRNEFLKLSKVPWIIRENFPKKSPKCYWLSAYEKCCTLS